MKNLFLISVCILMFSCGFSLLIGNTVYSQTTSSDKLDYLFPANKEKVFHETVDEFYQALRDKKYPVHQNLYQKYQHEQRNLDTVLFKDMPDASVNVRKKLLFNEVEELSYITFDGNLLRPYPAIEITYHQTVSPNRQVYFFYSFKDTDDAFIGRYAIYDVETKESVAGGNTYMPKSLIYK